MSRTRSVVAVVVAVLVIVAAYLLGAASEDPGPPPPPPPTPTATGVEPTSGATDVAGPTPDRSTSEETAAPPAPATPTGTPGPSPTPQALTGTASTTDPAGDVTDDAGVAAPGEPTAADVLAAQVEGDEQTLTFTYTLNGEVPPDGESLVWSTEFAVDGAQVALVTVEQVGARLFTGVFDPTTGEQEVLDGAASLTPGQLVVTVPQTALPPVEGPVEWFVLTQRDGGYEDRVPDEGAAGRLPFRD